MIKILYIGGFEMPNRNAAAQRVVSVAKTMRELGCDVTFIGVTKEITELNQEHKYEGFKYFSVKYPLSIKDWYTHITKFISFDRIKAINPDVVVLYNFPAMAQKKLTNYCHKRGIKVLVDLTEWYVTEGKKPRDIIKRWDTNRRMYKYNFDVDGVIAISKHLYNFYKNRVNTVYIPATVDLQEKKWERNRKVEIHKPIRLVYAGSPGTGQKDKLDILVKAVESKNDFILNVIGVTKEQFQSSFESRVIGDNVRFHGRVSHLEAIKMVRESDFEVIIRDDNLVTRAGFPTKFVEAYSCGTPVIATPTSNICDYLVEGINGFIVNENQSLNQILEKVEKMSEYELITIKKNAISLQVFDYRNYLEEIKRVLS